MCYQHRPFSSPLQYNPLGLIHVSTAYKSAVPSRSQAVPIQSQETTGVPQTAPPPNPRKDSSQSQPPHNGSAQSVPLIQLEEASSGDDNCTATTTAGSRGKQVLGVDTSDSELSTVIPSPSDPVLSEVDSEAADDPLSTASVTVDVGVSISPLPLPTAIENSQSIANAQVPVLPVASTEGAIVESEAKSQVLAHTNDVGESEGGQSTKEISKEVDSIATADQVDSEQPKSSTNSIDTIGSESRSDTVVSGKDKENIPEVQAEECKHLQQSPPGPDEPPLIQNSGKAADAKEEMVKEKQQEEGKKGVSSWKKVLGDLISDDTLSSDDEWDESLLPPPR